MAQIFSPLFPGLSEVLLKKDVTFSCPVCGFEDTAGQFRVCPVCIEHKQDPPEEDCHFLVSPSHTCRLDGEGCPCVEGATFASCPKLVAP